MPRLRLLLPDPLAPELVVDALRRAGLSSVVVEEEDGRVEALEREVRELRNLDTAKSQFLANVSHELRTPLTAIVTYGEVLTDELLGPLTDRQREAVEAIIHSSKQLLQMIEEVLTYARASAQAIRLEPSTFDLREVVREVHRANASLFVTRGLAYEEEFGADLPLAWGDRAKIQHVLANLVGNALDFTPAPGRITVRVRRWPENPAWLEVLVADTGIGIDPQYHELIFREFAQVDSSHARRHHGTGLGLTIARNFVQMHGGRIWVESALGAGSRFYFTVPTVEACAGATP